MINKQVKKIYFSNVSVKIFSGGVLIALISCALTWIKIEGLALFFATDIVKLVQNLKTITVVTSILAALWVWAGLFITEKNIPFVSISSGLIMLIFFYMAYSIFRSENIKEGDKITSIIVLSVYGLLYLIPIRMAIKNNFKSLFINTNLTLFFLLVSQLYIAEKFSNTAVKAIGIILQYSFYITILGVLTALVSSIILTIKIKKDVHIPDEPQADNEQENNPDNTVRLIP